MTVLVHHLGPWLPIMPLDTPGLLLDHCCLQSLGVGPRRWIRVDQGGPQWSRVVQGAPEGKTNFLTFLLMWSQTTSSQRHCILPRRSLASSWPSNLYLWFPMFHPQNSY